MSSTNPSTNLDPNSLSSWMKSLPRYSPPSVWDSSVSEQISQNYITTEELLEKLKPLTHDLTLSRMQFRAETPSGPNMVDYYLDDHKHNIGLTLEIQKDLDDVIRAKARRELSEQLSRVRIKYEETIEGHRRYLDDVARNNILHTYFGKRNHNYVFYDVEDYIRTILLPLDQAEPDWTLVVETGNVIVDPGQMPEIDGIMLSEVFIHASNVSFHDPLHS